MISDRIFWGGLLGIIGVYIAGLPATLMENDSAQFAVMAMRMVQENDFLSLWKGTEEYLDKPHMHYWLAAISFKIFGFHAWAYRLPALLFTLLGGYSAYGLGKLLYNKNSGRMAALIFLSAQTIVLSVIDVRTDAVLTGSAVFAIWQLARYLEGGRTSGLLAGALGAGIAFSTKGQIALLVIGLPLLCQLAYKRRWERLLNVKVLLALLVFILAISPMLYAYYQQFDLHPEKVIRGRDHRSGVFFILWEQSFERLSGEGVGSNSSDYVFFFHTFLWVFLPWTLMGLAAFGTGFMAGWRRLQGRIAKPAEVLTLGGIAFIFIIISFAQFKLPHYLNITIPLFAVLTAGFLDRQHREGRLRWLRRAAGVQAGILGIVVLLTALIVCWVFPWPLWAALLFLAVVLALAIVFYARIREPLPRLVVLSVMACVVANLVMNAWFYPELLTYQAGSELAAEWRREASAGQPIYKLSEEHTWALDFYSGSPALHTDLEGLRPGMWLFARDEDLERLKKRQLGWDRQLTADQFRITRLQARFVNPATRDQVLNRRHLVRIRPR